MRLSAFLMHFAWARWRSARLRGRRIAEFQDERAQAMVRHAIAKAPFFRRHFAGHDWRDWSNLPTIDKPTMMANFDSFNTVGVRLDDALRVALGAEHERDFRPTLQSYTVGLSSGTSGHRGLFLVSEYEQSAWAGFLLARTLPSLRRRGYTVAFFLRSNSNLYETLGSRWLRFRYFDLMMPLSQGIAALNREPPDFLVGPPSLLRMLAQAKQEGMLRIQPSRLISVAEVLDPEDRAALVSAFGCEVHQIYQCTEGLLAVCCPHGSLHIQEDLVALQLERLPGAADEPRYVPIVTDLWRRTQPIIRYRLNDVLTMCATRCRCGSDFRIIERIEGRCDDLVYFWGVDGERRVFFPDTIRRIVLCAASGIADYQAFQERVGALRFHLEMDPDADFDAVAASLRDAAQNAMARYNCQAATVAIERGLIPIPLGTKRRRVQRTNVDSS